MEPEAFLASFRQQLWRHVAFMAAVIPAGWLFARLVLVRADWVPLVVVGAIVLLAPTYRYEKARYRDPTRYPAWLTEVLWGIEFAALAGWAMKEFSHFAA